MTAIIEGSVYHWTKNDVMFCGVSVGGSATLELSFDGTTFTPAGAIPLPTGEIFAQFRLRNCYFKFTGITGKVNVKPSVKLA